MLTAPLARTSFAVLALLLAIAALVIFATGASAQSTRYVDGATGSDVPDCTNPAAPCETIQYAIGQSGPNDTVQVSPGTYAESVNLSLMDTLGDISLIASPGTVTVDPPSGPAFYTSSTHPGNVTIDGFIVTSPNDDGIRVDVNSDVVIANVTANNTGEEGFDIKADGDVTITDSSADGNVDDGFDIETETDGDVTITDSSANENDSDGFELEADGNIDVSDSSANENGNSGFDFREASNVTATNITAKDNGAEGFTVNDFAGDEKINQLTIQDSHLQGNGSDGTTLEHLDFGGTHQVNGNIICANVDNGLELGAAAFMSAAATVDAVGNWWGDASGPAPVGTGDAVDKGPGTVNFDPWVDTIFGSAAAATVGASSAVSFQFSDSGITVFLGQGPGDRNVTPPFTLTTDNGTVSPSSAFINKPDGTLEVTLTPASVGTATVTVTGPCGLEGSITLDVAAAPAATATPTPTPTPSPTPTPTPVVAEVVQLPTTGGTPSDGGSSALPWLAAIAGVIAAMSGGGLWLAYQRRRVR